MVSFRCAFAFNALRWEELLLWGNEWVQLSSFNTALMQAKYFSVNFLRTLHILINRLDYLSRCIMLSLPRFNLRVAYDNDIYMLKIWKAGISIIYCETAAATILFTLMSCKSKKSFKFCDFLMLLYLARFLWRKLKKKKVHRWNRTIWLEINRERNKNTRVKEERGGLYRKKIDWS